MTAKPTAAAFREWATAIGLPVPPDMLVIPLHGAKTGTYELCAFNKTAMYRYDERVAYLHRVVQFALGQGLAAEIIEASDHMTSVEVSIVTNLEGV